jgi:hypothetical protein
MGIPACKLEGPACWLQPHTDAATPPPPTHPQHNAWTQRRADHDSAAHPPGPFPLERLLTAATAVPDSVLTRLGESYMIRWGPC